jgi:hypothetical protein
MVAAPVNQSIKFVPAGGLHRTPLSGRRLFQRQRPLLAPSSPPTGILQRDLAQISDQTAYSLPLGQVK